MYKWIIVFLFIPSWILSQVYVSDKGNGKYQNPIIFADYSDPDVIRVEDDFFMVASSFNCVPGLPVLHSKDLVNWTIINHVLPYQKPLEVFDHPQHGNGVWAPAIRYHEGEYYVYYGDPDFGIIMSKTNDPWGEWDEAIVVQEGKGWIDPCPFWDDNGQAYLVHAFAGSRAGNKSILVMHKMTEDGTQLLDNGVLVFDGHNNHPTIEGPKMYKRNGYYYIFAPGGGVAHGWQTVLRSKNIYGPYDDKIVLHQGDTDINGPHQGAWLELENGEDWFIHFQERQPYGRIVHLQPAEWKNDWITIGEDKSGNGTGTPVKSWNKPDVGDSYPVSVPQTSDEFNSEILGLQWQWQGNPHALWMFPSRMGYLRMNPVIVDDGSRLWDLPNLLLQKFPAESFAATTKIDFHHLNDSEELGLVIMGRDYASLALRQESGQLFLLLKECINADQGREEMEIQKWSLDMEVKYLRVTVAKGGVCRFSYSYNGNEYNEIPYDFQAREGKWVGAKVGLYAIRNEHINNGGYANIDWFRISK